MQHNKESVQRMQVFRTEGTIFWNVMLDIVIKYIAYARPTQTLFWKNWEVKNFSIGIVKRILR